MLTLILGVLIWSLAHFFKRLSPDARERLTARLGERRSKIAVAAAIGLGVLLMIVGYRAAPFAPLYTPPGWACISTTC